MDISSFFTQIQDDATLARNGGLILKGRTRNTRQPVHMILAVDTSGSMELEDKLASVKRSISLMLALLSPEDRLSLVTFADDSKTFLNRVIPTPEERQAIQYRVNNLHADGSTNMSAGLLEARGLVEPPSSGRKQGLVLLTDGHANIGVHSEEGLIDILKRIQTESPGLSLTTVAYGVDHNSEMLTNMAKAGGGAYNVVTNLEDVATVFGDILGGLISISAQKVEVQLPPGAKATTSFRTETNADGMTTIYVGDLYADAEITILFHSAPSFGPIRIKATDMTTLNLIDEISDPVLLTDINHIPVTLCMAEYRYKTTELLNKFRKTNGSLSLFQPEIEALIKQLQDDDRVRDHPLKPMLLEDLENALKLSKRGGHLSQSETIEMAQHTAYIGMSKGLRSTTNHVPPAPQRSRGLRRQVAANTLHYPNMSAVGSLPPSPPQTSPVLAAVTSPFANRMQTQIASVMRTMSMQPQEDEENSQR
jgi:Mg-chelatase subunit ChlD